MQHRSLIWAAVSLACGVLCGCGSSDRTDTLQGAGATFPAPLYKRWFLEYYKLHPDVRINFQPVGSGAGIRQFTEGVTTFGASDAYMSQAEIDRVREKGRDVVLLPMTAGSVVLCYNLPDGPLELKLSRKVYVDIFLGNINTWADSRIQQDNPEAYLPDVPITVVRRSDGSGTTYAFTNHLNAISNDWKKENGGPGKGKAVTWPVGVGGKGNSGVAALIEQTPGAIGYLEFGYAELLLEQLPKGKGNRPVNVAVLENKTGRFVRATHVSGRAALSGPSLKKDPANLHIELPDPEAADAYPIVTYTWLLCSKHYENVRIAADLKDAIRFCLTNGQKFSAELGYITLPDEVREQVLRAVDQITP